MLQCIFLNVFYKARSEQVVETATNELPKKTEEKVASTKRKSSQSALIMKAVKRKRSMDCTKLVFGSFSDVFFTKYTSLDKLILSKEGP